jgi:uncharacterized membrane protein YwzB
MNMKRYFKKIIATLATASMLVMPTLALAQASNPVAAGLTKAAGNTGLRNLCAGQGDVRDCIAGIIGNLIGVVLGFVEVVLFLLFLWAGFKWMTAQGEEKQVKEAKQMIRDAVIGLVVIGLSYLLTQFVIDQLNTSVVGSSTEGTTTPPPASGGAGT